jgi:hypothetical protein
MFAGKLTQKDRIAFATEMLKFVNGSSDQAPTTPKYSKSPVKRRRRYKKKA